MRLESKLDDFIVKFSGRGLIYEYLILTPCHLMVLGMFHEAENKISVEMQETFLNICPAIVNAVTGLSNSAGSLMEVISAINRNWKNKIFIQINFLIYQNFKTVEIEEKKPQLFSNLQEIKRYDSDEFWFTKKRGL